MHKKGSSMQSKSKIRQQKLLKFVFIVVMNDFLVLLGIFSEGKVEKGQKYHLHVIYCNILWSPAYLDILMCACLVSYWFKLTINPE